MEALTEEQIKLPKKKILAIDRDPEKTAKAIDLIYVHDSQPGIQRIKKGKSFEYQLGEKSVNDEETLARIKSLVIPPAWESVWICKSANGHLQATGIDTKNRKQYRYHPMWNALRNHTKYYRLNEFGKVLPGIRQQLEKDISLPGLPVEKVLALVVMLMEKTNIRVGNNFYEKLYGSFGLTTLKDKHVSINGNAVQFMFKGKKGVEHNISLKSKRLANLVKKCRDIPGKELFQYYDETGTRRPIDSGMVNDYIRKISGADFSTKDFRTWSGTLLAYQAFKEMGAFESDTECRKKISGALDMVAKQLGNTRTVCKKYYVHPSIISSYEKKLFIKIEDVLNIDNKNEDALVSLEEQVVLKIIESNNIILSKSA
jgi:DNA topoisomerase-1